MEAMGVCMKAITSTADGSTQIRSWGPDFLTSDPHREGDKEAAKKPPKKQNNILF